MTVIAARRTFCGRTHLFVDRTTFAKATAREDDEQDYDYDNDDEQWEPTPQSSSRCSTEILLLACLHDDERQHAPEEENPRWQEEEETMLVERLATLIGHSSRTPMVQPVQPQNHSASNNLRKTPPFFLGPTVASNHAFRIG